MRGTDEMGECGSEGKDMDGKEEVMEDVMESHLSCLDSVSDTGCDADRSCSGWCSGGVDVEVQGPPGNTVYSGGGGKPEACFDA